MRPPISYYGGKQRMASKIVPLIPKHTVYVEPFAGGAAVMFAKPWPKVTNPDHYREVINDLDGRIINFYKQLRDNGEGLIRRIQLTPYSEREHAEAKTRMESEADPLERARFYYVNVMQSFTNRISGGWRRGVFGNNLAVTNLNKVAQLPEYLERMGGVHFSNQDALEVIRQWDSPQTFFYCDPPYPGTDQGHYEGYTIEDFANLVKALDNCQGSFILSNYEQPGIPIDWERFEFSAYSSASRKGKVGVDRSKKAERHEWRKRSEVVWRRFNRVAVRPEIKKLYETGKYDCFGGDDADQTD
jgi:DNA adenine methylase